MLCFNDMLILDALFLFQYLFKILRPLYFQKNQNIIFYNFLEVSSIEFFNINLTVLFNYLIDILNKL